MRPGQLRDGVWRRGHGPQTRGSAGQESRRSDAGASAVGTLWRCTPTVPSRCREFYCPAMEHGPAAGASPSRYRGLFGIALHDLVGDVPGVPAWVVFGSNCNAAYASCRDTASPSRKKETLLRLRRLCPDADFWSADGRLSRNG